jgi:hypothetical protein
VFKPRRFILLLLILAGLTPLAAAGADSAWVARKLPWYALPSQQLISSAPLSFTVPAKAWDYGARTDRLDAFAANGPVIMRVSFKVESGSVGVSLMTGDGSTLISKEKVLTAKEGVSVVYFRIDRQTGPCTVVLRNPGVAGAAGMGEVQDVQLARETALSADEMARVKLGLL